jgi:hypothetical protein
MAQTYSSLFQAQSFDELLKPLLMLGQAHAALESKLEELDETTSQVAKLKNSTKDAAQYKVYEQYQNQLETVRDQLMQNGVMNTNYKSDARGLTRMFRQDIKPIMEAMNKRSERAKIQQDMRMQNPDILFERDASDVALQEFIDNPDLNLGESYNLEQIRQQAKAEYQALQNEILNTPYEKIKADLPRFYTAVANKYGLKAEDIATAIQTKDPNSLINKIAARLIDSSGVLNWRDMRDEEGKLTQKGLNMYNKLYGAATTYANQAIGKTEVKEIYDNFGAEIAKMDYAAKLEAQKQKEQEQLLEPSTDSLAIGGTDSISPHMTTFSQMGLDANGKVKVLTSEDILNSNAASRVKSSKKYNGQSLVIGQADKKNKNQAKDNRSWLQRGLDMLAAGGSADDAAFNLTESSKKANTNARDTAKATQEARNNLTLWNKSGTLKSRADFVKQGGNEYSRALLSEYYTDAVNAITNMRKDANIQQSKGQIGKDYFPYAQTVANETRKRKPVAQQATTADVYRMQQMPLDNKKAIVDNAIMGGDATMIDRFVRDEYDASGFKINGKKVSSNEISKFLPKNKNDEVDYNKLYFQASTTGNNQGFIITNTETNKRMFVPAAALGNQINTIFTLGNQNAKLNHAIRSDVKRRMDEYGETDAQALSYLVRNNPEYTGVNYQTLADLDYKVQQDYTLWYTQIIANTATDATYNQGIIKDPSYKVMSGN